MLPCPFCGNDKIRVWRKEDSEYWNVQCDSGVCGAMLYDENSSDDAIAIWNRRATTY